VVLIKKLASLLILTSLFVASAASPGMAEIDSILLANCLFPTNKSQDCPIWEQRNNLSIKKKHKFVVELNEKEVANNLAQHEACYAKRFTDFWQE